MPTDLVSLPDPFAASEADRRDPHPFKSFIATALRHRGALAASFLVPFVGAVALSFVPPRIYTAEARLLALIGQEYVFRPDVGEAGAGMALDAAAITKSEVEILQSRSLAEEVLEAVGPTVLYPDLAVPEEPSPVDTAVMRVTERAVQAGLLSPTWLELDQPEPMSDREQALKNFNAGLTVEPIRDSSVIRVAFQHTDRMLAASTLNQLIEAYFERRGDILRNSRAAAALVGPLAEIDQRLKENAQALDALRREYAVVDFDQETTLLLEQQAATDATRRRAEEDLARARERLADLKRTLESTPREVTLYVQSELVASHQIQKSRLAELEAERANMRSRLLPNHPQVVAIGRQIERLKQQLAGSIATEETRRIGVNTVREHAERAANEVQAEVAALEAMVATSAAHARDLQERAARLREANLRYRELERLDGLLLEQQRAYAARMEDLRVLNEIGQNRSDNMRLIQAALPPIEGSNLRGVIQVLGLLTGIIVALFVAFLLEASRSVFIIPQNAATALGLPVLATVQQLGLRQRWQLRGPRSSEPRSPTALFPAQRKEAD
jgi:uncharacterized protein involved in exopolysaccharide biosynthesis